jgi:hypothetical protein
VRFRHTNHDSQLTTGGQLTTDTRRPTTDRRARLRRRPYLCPGLSLIRLGLGLVSSESHGHAELSHITQTLCSMPSSYCRDGIDSLRPSTLTLLTPSRLDIASSHLTLPPYHARSRTLTPANARLRPAVRSNHAPRPLSRVQLSKVPPRRVSRIL